MEVGSGDDVIVIDDVGVPVGDAGTGTATGACTRACMQHVHLTCTHARHTAVQRIPPCTQRYRGYHHAHSGTEDTTMHTMCSDSVAKKPINNILSLYKIFINAVCLLIIGDSDQTTTEEEFGQLGVGQCFTLSRYAQAYGTCLKDSNEPPF